MIDRSRCPRVENVRDLRRASNICMRRRQRARLPRGQTIRARPATAALDPGDTRAAQPQFRPISTCVAFGLAHRLDHCGPRRRRNPVPAHRRALCRQHDSGRSPANRRPSMRIGAQFSCQAFFGPIGPARWIAEGLAHSSRSGREPDALRWASCPGFAHSYNPVRANPPFDAA
jgi:hypothetical protein